MGVELSLAAERGVSETARPDLNSIYLDDSDFVWRTLQQLGVRDADLEDLLQEVFVVVHRRLHTFDGRSKVTTWLFGICLRVASRYRRRAYFRLERLGWTPPEPPDPRMPDDRLEARDARATMERLLAGLRLKHRIVFILFELEGKTCEEIAEMVDAPIGTVFSRLHTARKHVRARARRLSAVPEVP
jgi:RNA polymerase sigma-70 factor (ECF subfamily)